MTTHKIAAAKAGVSTNGTRGECAQRICTAQRLAKKEKHGKTNTHSNQQKLKFTVNVRQFTLMQEMLEKNIANGTVPVDEREYRVNNIKAICNRMCKVV